MRALWTNELVTYEGRWHKITDAGLNPLPVQRPIPIWFGGSDERVLRRIARIGDGWLPLRGSYEERRAAIARLHDYARQEGRDPADIGIESWVSIGGLSPDQWVEAVQEWKELGATHVSVNTMKAGLSSPGAHIEAITQFKETVAGLVA